jgi:hypothetical protein
VVTQYAADTEHWDAAVATGLVRVGAGVLLLTQRDMAIKFAGGSPSDRLLRGLFTFWGVRDLALGVGALAATRPSADVPKQITYQGVADTIDTAIVAGLVAQRRLTRVRGYGATAIAAGTALSGFAMAWRLRRA